MLAVEIRSGLVETIHHGAFAAFDSSMELVASSGDIDTPFFLRSSAKPFQALVAQDFGAELEPLELALACASHDGWPVHIEIVRMMLTRAGLDSGSLQCPPLWPLSAGARDLLVADGHKSPRRIWHDCSGKHAAWLRACVSSGLPTDSYLSPDHPVQVAVRSLITEAGEFAVEPVGVDGCGAPVMRTTVRAMARMYAVLACDDRFAGVYEAMHRYPALVSGVGNGDAVLATSLDAVSKRGALGCIGVGLRNQMGIAVKAWDGNDRVAALAAAHGLNAIRPQSEFVTRSLDGAAVIPILGGGQPVGSFESRLELTLP